MNCMFCSVTAFNGARYRQRSIPEVVREFQSIPEKRVLVVDDNLIGTRPEHIARGVGARLLCLGTVGNRRFPGHLDGRRRTIST